MDRKGYLLYSFDAEENLMLLQCLVFSCQRQAEDGCIFYDEDGCDVQGV
jgi:hypothetical protein